MTQLASTPVYTVRTDAFEGPLDLLLQLVEGERLSVSEISLASVTEAFLAAVRQRAEDEAYPLEGLAHFLVIASKLVALKARLLVPTAEASDDDEPSLVARLLAYQAYIRAGQWLQARSTGGALLFSRGEHEEVHEAPLPWPPSTKRLQQAFHAVLQRAEAPPVPPKALFLARLVRLEDRMASLRERIASVPRLSLFSWVGPDATREFRLVSFLAVLELVRRHEISADQGGLFTDVTLTRL